MRPILLVGLLGLLSTSNPATATPIRTYQLSLTFSCIDDLSSTENECLDEFRDVRTGRSVKTGVAYEGQFTVAEFAFDNDGYTDVGFESFYFALADTVWDSRRPCTLQSGGSDYCGSRGNNPETHEGGLRPWTLLIEDHELAGLCCGVYGRSDQPFIDLYSHQWPFNPLTGDRDYVLATPFYYSGIPECPDCRQAIAAFGEFSFFRVREPSPSSLLAFGLLAIAFVARRRPSRS